MKLIATLEQQYLLNTAVAMNTTTFLLTIHMVSILASNSVRLTKDQRASGLSSINRCDVKVCTANLMHQHHGDVYRAIARSVTMLSTSFRLNIIFLNC